MFVTTNIFPVNENETLLVWCRKLEIYNRVRSLFSSLWWNQSPKLFLVSQVTRRRVCFYDALLQNDTDPKTNNSLDKTYSLCFCFQTTTYRSFFPSLLISRSRLQQEVIWQISIQVEGHVKTRYCNEKHELIKPYERAFPLSRDELCNKQFKLLDDQYQ